VRGMKRLSVARLGLLLTVLAALAAGPPAGAAPPGAGGHWRPGPHRGGPGPPGNGARTGAYSETHFGLTCTWSRALGSAVCARADGTGLQVTVSRRLVTVRAQGGAVVFSRAQPRGSRRPAAPPGAGAAFSHSDGNVLCQWSSASGGSALCRAADGTGYTAGVLSTVAVVISDSSSIVFIGKQPQP